MKSCRFAAIFVLRCFAVGVTPLAWANPILVTSNDVLEIRFILPQPPPADYDLLYVNLVNLDILSPIGTHSASLFDRNSLLGTVTNDLGGDYVGTCSALEEGAWKTAGSVYVGGPGRSAVIDFSSMSDGDIKGRVEYTFETGSFLMNDLVTNNYNYDSPNESSIWAAVGQGIGYGAFRSLDDYAPVITHIKVHSIHPIPEPSTLALLGIGIVGLIGYGWRRGRHSR
jgi:hypothetical protein